MTRLHCIFQHTVNSYCEGSEALQHIELQHCKTLVCYDGVGQITASKRAPLSHHLPHLAYLADAPERFHARVCCYRLEQEDGEIRALYTYPLAAELFGYLLTMRQFPFDTTQLYAAEVLHSVGASRLGR